MKTMPPAEKLKILHINAEKEYRGGETQTICLSKKLIERGHESTICCQPGSGIERKCTDNKLPCLSTAMVSDIDLRGAYAIRRWLSRNPVSIIHSHNPRALAMGFILKLSGNSIPHIHTRRIDFPISGKLSSKIKYSRGADSIIAVSSAVKESLVHCGVEESKITVIPGGIDKEKFQRKTKSSSLKDEFSIPDNSFIIGAVSHLSRHKGHIYLINAMEGICRSRKNTFLIIAGEGNLKSELIKISRDKGLADNIIFAGFRNDMENILPQFDILVHPTIEGEGSPSAIKEAMIAGVPVLASDIAPVREIISSGNVGILFPPAKNEEIEKAVLNMIDNPEIRKKISSEALKKAEKQFGIDESVERTEALYYQTLNM